MVFPIKHKFRAKPVNDDGIHFASRLEHRYYIHLKFLVKSGAVLFFLRQVPFHLPGGVKYVCDYQVFYADGDVSFIDVKGVETEVFKIKKKQVEEIYPVKIELITSNFFRSKSY